MMLATCSCRTGTSCQYHFLIGCAPRSCSLTSREEEEEEARTHAHMHTHARAQSYRANVPVGSGPRPSCELVSLLAAQPFSDQPKYMTSSFCNAPPPRPSLLLHRPPPAISCRFCSSPSPPPSSLLPSSLSPSLPPHGFFFSQPLSPLFNLSLPSPSLSNRRFVLAVSLHAAA